MSRHVMECGVVDLLLTKYHHLHPQEKKKIQLLHNWAPNSISAADCLWGWRRVQNVKQNCKAMNHAECHHNFFRHWPPSSTYENENLSRQKNGIEFMTLFVFPQICIMQAWNATIQWYWFTKRFSIKNMYDNDNLLLS